MFLYLELLKFQDIFQDISFSRIFPGQTEFQDISRTWHFQGHFPGRGNPAIQARVVPQGKRPTFGDTRPRPSSWIWEETGILEFGSSLGLHWDWVFNLWISPEVGNTVLANGQTRKTCRDIVMLLSSITPKSLTVRTGAI